ncbi:MAG: ABC transporter permease [Planctomycetes bacterium]|nr:ABC transporter permease [Planctomycetota bacterium]
MNFNVLKSIFKRDFVSYFSSPTGYAFICVFVVLSALATFWPPEFFSSNLANLDQLSRWLPFIMLVFIPAITMSIWAEERRQGTDELLLTVPATDFDVVLGKYLAGVAIFSVSLMFSAFSIFLVFKWGLGDPDFGLFVSTYIGYWFIGVAMIAIGMVASFLTENLTVGFILGTLFNMPLALFGVADWFVTDPGWAQTVRHWSASEQFRDFERGVISLGGVTYFVAIAAVMVYLSMVLIGRRHWQAREEGGSLGWHYLARTLALLCLAVGVTQIVQNRNSLRADISSEQLSSLSAGTLDILRDLRDDEDVRSISIDAYVSPRVPTEYVEKKTNLLSTLAEFQALSGGKIRVNVHEIENYGEEANLAERTYSITPREVLIVNGRERSREEIFLGFAVTSGLGKVVVPFLGKGIPAEYELVRSIATVTRQKNLRVGILDTGVQGLMPSSNRDQEWPLLAELRKQYDIDDRPVDPSQPINVEKYDVLLAVQPSMLGPQEMDHLVDAVRAGLPTAILEDPMPIPAFYRPPTVGTADPKRSPGMGMFGGGQQPLPKGDITQLWKTLGIEMEPTELVWQEYQPDRTVRIESDQEWIFIDQGNEAQDPLNSDNPITSGLNQLLFLYAGSVTQAEDSKLKFQQLAVTGSSNSGTIEVPLLRQQMQSPGGQVFGHVRSSSSYIIGAQIEGEYINEDLLLNKELALEEMAKAAASTDDDSTADETTETAADTNAETETGSDEATPIKAVVVADIDWIIPAFFMIRESGDGQVIPATQNVTFILNIIDALAGDDRFIEIRKRVRKHRTLTKIDEATKSYRENANKQEKKFLDQIKEELAEAQKTFEEEVAAVSKLEGLSEGAKQQRIEIVRRRAQERLQADLKSIETRRNRNLKQIEYDLEQEVRTVQGRYKKYAIMIPPIPPLLVALYVFFRRRETEREGIVKERLR